MKSQRFKEIETSLKKQILKDNPHINRNELAEQAEQATRYALSQTCFCGDYIEEHVSGDGPCKVLKDEGVICQCPGFSPVEPLPGTENNNALSRQII